MIDCSGYSHTLDGARKAPVGFSDPLVVSAESQRPRAIHNIILQRTFRTGYIFLSCVSCLWTISCTTVAPDPGSQAGAFNGKCPEIPTSIGQCSDIHLLRTSLTCGGSGKTSIAVSKAPGGANRFSVQLMNGTRFQGTLITPDPACVIKDGTDADFTFGVVYTGDQGVETADGSMSPCIVQSKMVYSSFNFDLAGMAANEGLVKDKLHQIFDKEVINQLFVAPGSPPLVGRCQRWREMP